MATAKYPGGIVSKTELPETTDDGEVSLTLAAQILNTDTPPFTVSFNEGDLSALPTAGFFWVGASGSRELMRYDSLNDTNDEVTVQARNLDGAGAVTHAANADVKFGPAGPYYNQMLEELIAIETELSQGRVYDVQAYGAVSGDTGDQSTDIQSAIDAAEAAGGGIVWVPQGTFRCTSDLTVDASNVIIRGTGYGSTLHMVNARLHLDGEAAHVERGGVEDLRILRDGGAGVALDITGGGSGTGFVRFLLKKVFITSTSGTGLRLAGSQIGVFHDLTIQSCTTGMVHEADPVAGTVFAPGMSFHGGEIQSCGTAATITQAAGLAFHGTIFQGCSTAGVDLTNNARGVSFNGCYFEQNAGYDIRIGNSTGIGHGIDIRGSYFADSTAAKDHAISLIRGQDVIVEANHFVGYAAEAIDVQEAAAGNVTGRAMFNFEDGTGIVALNGAAGFDVVQVGGNTIIANDGSLSSAVLNTAVSGTAVLDEDNMASNSDTQIATQQSIKAYVDAQGTSLPVADTTSIVEGSADNTKELRIEVDGLTTSTVRVWTAQDLDGTVYVTGGQDVTVADGGTGASTASAARTNLGLGTGDTVSFNSLNINSSRFVVASTGAVDIIRDGASGLAQGTVYGGGVTSRAMLFVGRKAQGTEASPAAVGANDLLFRLSGRGYTSAGSFSGVDAASISLVAEEAFTASAQGTKIQMNTTPTGSTTPSTVLEIDNAGLVSMSGTLNIGSSTAVGSILDEDTMSSDSATALATQQSIKAYVDANAGGTDRVVLAYSTGSSSLNAGSAQFMGFGDMSTQAPTTHQVVPISGTVTAMYVYSDGPPGTGETYTAEVSLNGSNQTMTCTISGASSQAANTTANQVAVTAGDRLNIRISSSGGAATEQLAGSLLIEPS